MSLSQSISFFVFILNVATTTTTKLQKLLRLAVVNNAQTNFYRDCRKLERVLNCIPETLGLGERETERVHRVQLHNLSLILKAGEDKFLLIGSHLSSYRGSHPDERSDITPWNFVLKFFRFHGHNFSLALWPSWFAELVFYFILGMWHCLSASATTDVDDSLLILFHLRVLVLYTLRLMIRFNLYYYRHKKLCHYATTKLHCHGLGYPTTIKSVSN